MTPATSVKVSPSPRRSAGCARWPPPPNPSGIPGRWSYGSVTRPRSHCPERASTGSRASPNDRPCSVSVPWQEGTERLLAVPGGQRFRRSAGLRPFPLVSGTPESELRHLGREAADLRKCGSAAARSVAVRWERRLSAMLARGTSRLVFASSRRGGRLRPGDLGGQGWTTSGVDAPQQAREATRVRRSSSSTSPTALSTRSSGQIGSRNPVRAAAG